MFYPKPLLERSETYDVHPSFVSVPSQSSLSSDEIHEYVED
jgi:hypothetical protein